ncbi:hypothetical protein, partial [Streptomyces zhihengii]
GVAAATVCASAVWWLHLRAALREHRAEAVPDTAEAAPDAGAEAAPDTAEADAGAAGAAGAGKKPSPK